MVCITTGSPLKNGIFCRARWICSIKTINWDFLITNLLEFDLNSMTVFFNLASKTSTIWQEQMTCETQKTSDIIQNSLCAPARWLIRCGLFRGWKIGKIQINILSDFTQPHRFYLTKPMWEVMQELSEMMRNIIATHLRACGVAVNCPRGPKLENLDFC